MPAADIQVASWTALKTLVVSKGLLLQYQEGANYYQLFAIDYNIGYFFTMLKNDPADQDQLDFETNFKPTANQKIPLVFVTIPSPYSLKPTRVYKDAKLTAQNSNQTLYTVTNGKKLYVTSINITATNSSVSNVGNIQIRDNTTEKIPVLMPTAGIGALASMVPVTISNLVFPEPKQFSTNININITSGTITYSVDFTGYEE